MVAAFLRDGTGATSIEYAIIASAVSIVAVLSFSAVADGAGSIWNYIAESYPKGQ